MKLLQLSRQYIVEGYIQLLPGAFCYKIQGRILGFISSRRSLKAVSNRGSVLVSLGPALCPSGRCFQALRMTLLTSTWHCRLAQSPHFIKSLYWLEAALGEGREHLTLGQAGAVPPVGTYR